MHLNREGCAWACELQNPYRSVRRGGGSLHPVTAIAGPPGSPSHPDRPFPIPWPLHLQSHKRVHGQLRGWVLARMCRTARCRGEPPKGSHCLVTLVPPSRAPHRQTLAPFGTRVREGATRGTLQLGRSGPAGGARPRPSGLPGGWGALALGFRPDWPAGPGEAARRALGRGTAVRGGGGRSGRGLCSRAGTTAPSRQRAAAGKCRLEARPFPACPAAEKDGGWSGAGGWWWPPRLRTASPPHLGGRAQR